MLSEIDIQRCKIHAPLTDADRKLLTEMIGEQYHDSRLVFIPGVGETFSCSCLKEGNLTPGFHANRTFDTGNDMMAVKEAIEKAGRWSQFEDFTFWEWQKIPLTEMTTHMQWLIDPARFCALAAKWKRTN